MPKLLNSSHVLKRILIADNCTWEVTEMLGIKEHEVIGFYEENGRIFIKRME
jgi:hypothetical protein